MQLEVSLVHYAPYLLEVYLQLSLTLMTSLPLKNESTKQKWDLVWPCHELRRSLPSHSLPAMNMNPDETDAQLVEVISLGPRVGKQEDLLLVPPLYNSVSRIFFSSLSNAQYKQCSFQLKSVGRLRKMQTANLEITPQQSLFSDPKIYCPLM